MTGATIGQGEIEDYLSKKLFQQDYLHEIILYFVLIS